MNNNQAKLILSVYRPHGQDATDRFFADALRQAERDPGMAAWFAEQQRFDEMVSAALSSVPVPADAKALIRPAMGVSVRRRWHLTVLAMAAGFAVLLSLTYFKVRRDPRELALPEDVSVAELAANLAEHHRSIGLMSKDFGHVRRWLAERGGPVPEELPRPLASLMVLGCETWQTNRGKVSLVCFVDDAKQMVHLYIFDDATGHTGLPGLHEPRMERAGGWNLALWQNGGRAYVLGVPADSGRTPESYLHS